MIQVKNVTKSFQATQVLKGVSFEVAKGEICALLAVEGAGKTTLADIVTGCADADGGKVIVCGQEMDSLSGVAKQYVGYMPAVPPLYRDMTPRTYFKFVAEAHGYGTRESNEMIAKTLRELHLNDIADEPLRVLSDSFRRLVSLGQATLCDPDVIVIDEPTKDLEPREIAELRAAVANLKADHAVLVLTDSISEACRLCDRAVVLHEGKTVADCSPWQLHEAQMDTSVLALRVKGEEAQVKKALSDAGRVEACAASCEADAVDVQLSSEGDVREKAFAALCRAGLPILRMQAVAKGLDEILLDLRSEPFVVSQTAGGEAEAHEGDL